LTATAKSGSQKTELVRTIGRWSLVALMANSMLGAGIFRLPAMLAGWLDGYSPLSCVISGAGALVVAACIAEVSSRFDSTGGLYLYGRVALGRFVGLLIGWLILLTRISAPAAAADLFAGYLAQFFPALQGKTWEIVVIAVLVGHLGLLNYVGVKTGKTVSDIFTTVKVALIGGFAVAGLLTLWLRPEVRLPLHYGPTTLRGWLEALLLLVFGYGGFEGALIVGGEARNPKRDMPFALLAALALQCLLYTGVVYVVAATLPDAGHSVRPLADAARNFLGSRGAAAIGLGALISTYGYLSANLLHSTRITFALAEQGDFPALFGRVHAKFHTPHVSIAAYSLSLFVFAALGDFRWNAILSAATRLVVYGGMAVAVLVLRARNGRAPFTLPAGWLFSAVCLAVVLVLLSAIGKGEAVVLALTAATALVNWLAIRGRPAGKAGEGQIGGGLAPGP
jgi:basic amino acid/polyamine antiporter, APA family